MAVLCALFLIVCYYDYHQKRIPNRLILLILLNGLIYRFGKHGIMGILLFVGQSILIFLLFYIFFRIGALGAGDIKLLALTAGYLHFEKILPFLMVSMLISAVISLILLFHESRFLNCMRNLLEYVVSWCVRSERKIYPGISDGKSLTVCMSGPVFFSLLLYLGGVY